MGYQPRHRNPMIALHGPGPDGTLCRHCDHLDSDLQGKEKGRFFCKIAIGDSLEGEECPSLQGSHHQGYIPAIREIAKQNPKLYLADYQKYNHRMTWPTCALFSGQAVMTYICKGPCGKEHTIARTGYDSRRFTGYCQSCAEITHREKRELARKMAEEMLPKRKAEDGGEVRVCYPVKAKEGAKRKRCLGNSIAEECPAYMDCLEYACMMMWDGFRDCGDEEMKAKKGGNRQ